MTSIFKTHCRCDFPALEESRSHFTSSPTKLNEIITWESLFDTIWCREQASSGTTRIACAVASFTCCYTEHHSRFSSDWKRRGGKKHTKINNARYVVKEKCYFIIQSTPFAELPYRAHTHGNNASKVCLWFIFMLFSIQLFICLWASCKSHHFNSVSYHFTFHSLWWWLQMARARLNLIIT